MKMHVALAASIAALALMTACAKQEAASDAAPAAQDAGRQYGVISVMPGAAAPANSTVP